jgi:hypothetical protein
MVRAPEPNGKIKQDSPEYWAIFYHFRWFAGDSTHS